MSKYSAKAQRHIAGKMKKMAGEKKPFKQKIAIAIEDARSKGYKVPKRKKS